MVERIVLFGDTRLKCKCAIVIIVKLMEDFQAGQSLRSAPKRAEMASKHEQGTVQIHYLSMVV